MDRKMFFYLVVLLSLSWPRVTGAGNKKVDEAAFDQIATASENVAQKVAEKVEQRRDNFRDQLITSMIDTTVHYENSNGFVPILVPTASPFDPRQQLGRSALEKGKETTNVTLNNSLNENENSSRIEDSGEEKEETKETGESDEFVNDPMYSTEARILLNFSNLNANRRSFEYQGNQNDFDLLKVRNDTPEIANYPNLYEESTGGGKILDEQSSKRSRGQTKDRKLEGYVGNYGMVVSPSSKNNEDDYSFYYSADSAEDKERKRSHDREKVGGNYEQHRYVTGYGGQNEPSASSFPRLNQEVNVFLKTNVKNDVPPSSSSQLTNSHKFSRPVVVAEPNYNKFDQPSGISDVDADDYRTSRIIEGSSEVSHRYTMNNRDGRFENDEDSRDTSDDSDYVEYTERPRKVQQKNRRRPNGNSKRLPKEHRGSVDDSAEHKGQVKMKHHSSRSRQAHRQRVRGGNSWSDESDRHQEQEDSYEDVRYDGRLSETRHAKSQSVKFKPSTSWNQISPNLEISHSSGIEIDQLEKPKLIVPVKVNLVPTSFDHATAIGSSQGFDVSNAILRNIVSSSANAPSSAINPGGNEGKIRVSTPLPDIIVGQGNFRNSMHAVLPQANGQLNNRFPPNLKPQYLSTTIAPVFTVSPNPNFQIQDTTRTSIVDPSNHMSTNNAPRLILPQPTLQTLSTLVQTPLTGSDYIQVNPHGMHGQNPISNGNLQVQPLPTLPTVAPTAHAIPVTKINLITSESQGKNALLPETDTNFLATASLAVGHNDHGQKPNDNSYYLENSNGQQIVKQPAQLVQPAGFYPQTVNVPPSRAKTTYVQTTNLLPAVLQPLPTYTTLSASTPSVQPFRVEAGGDQGQQLAKQSVVGELENAASNSRNVKFPSLAYQMIDSAGSHSTDNVNTVNGLPGVAGMIGNGHLPHVGTRNVEIVNPNMKPSTFPDASIINTYETMHYPAAVLTTSIPMFATTSFVTARPALLSSTVEPMQNAAASTTEARSVDDNRASNTNVDPTKPYLGRDRPVYNPLNFVPNVDVVKSQNALNSKLHAVEPLQQNLNLVPLLPGGNFFKPSFSAQSELLVKPKLNSDLQAYAEQMFKESLKTIYNTQKWNNDRKTGLYNRYNITDSDIARLKNELQRLKASLDSRKKKNHDADPSETKVRTTELANRKPDELMAALEQMLKKNPSDSLHNFHGTNKPHRHRRPNEKDNYSLGTTGDLRENKYEFLTPPQLNSHRGKNHFQTVDKPGKKRPGSSRYKSYNHQNHHHNHHHHHQHHHGPRSHPRSNSKAGGIEASGSNIEPVRVDGLSKYGNIHDSRQFRKGSPFDSHLGSTSPFSREKISHFSKTGLKGVEKGKESAYNNPKMHNFYGMLMKNKQLPGGDTPNYFRDKDQLKQFFETEKQRMQQKFYDDALRDYFKKMSDLGYTGISNSRISSPEKRKV